MKPEGDYSASPKVWEDKAGFDAKIAGFAKVVGEAKGKIKDLRLLRRVSRGRQGMRRLPRDVSAEAEVGGAARCYEFGVIARLVALAHWSGRSSTPRRGGERCCLWMQPLSDVGARRAAISGPMA